MAALPILSALTPLITRVLDMIPNPQARAEAQSELMTKLVEIEAEQKLAQVELNKVEAKHQSVFVAGWRPFIGWVGGVALAWTFILHPVLIWGATVFGYEGGFPDLETDELLTLVFAMLGVGAMRSFDKLKGVDTKSVGAPKQTKPTYNE